MAALITGGMLAAGLAAPAIAQDSVGGQASCVDDPTGDTRKKSNDDASADLRADITRYCVTSGPQASFHVSIAQPTDPATDGGWQGATFVGWFVDTEGDDSAEYYIDFSLDSTGSAASTETAEVKNADDEVVCTVPASLTRSGYAISGVDSDCFGGAETARAEVAMYYDNGSDVVYDTATTLPEQDISSDRGTRRLNGDTRTETSVKISQEQFSPGEAATVYLSRDDVFADAAVGGTLTDGPILVVPSCGDVPDVVKAEIDRLRVGSVTALGGEEAICEQMLDTASEGTGQDRLGGVDRYATSVEIARDGFDSADRVYLARADEFIDAVAGGVLTDGPILLVPQCGDVPQVIENAVDEFDPDEVVALGGPVAICEPALTEAAGGRTTDRIAGETRYGTAIQIAQYVFPEPTAEKVYLARADLVVDALAGGVLTLSLIHI